MARFTGDRRLVQAIIDGVAEMLRVHADRGWFDGHDLVHWLNENRNPERNDLYDLYHDCVDPEMTADQQIGKFLYTLGQIKTGERLSERRISRTGAPANRDGACTVPIWEASSRSKDALEAAREEWLSAADQRDQLRYQAIPPVEDDWLTRITGAFKDDPEFEKVLEYGREFRRSDRPEDEEGKAES
jgi:hypothetical protein